MVLSNCLHFLVTQYYSASDNFTSRIRKNFVTLLLVLLFIPIGYNVLNILKANGEGARWFEIASIYLVAIYTIASYLWMRRVGGEVSDRHIGIFMWAVTITLTAPYIVSPNFDNKSLLLTMLFLASMLQHPHMKLFTFVCVAQCLLIDWNSANVGFPERQLALPGGYKNEIIPNLRFPGFLAGTCLMFSCAWMVYHHVKTITHKEASQEATIELTMKVLKFQRRYDTNRIEELLEECDEEGVVGKDLLMLYREMNANLKTYKPFLPNYLFLGSEEDGVVDAMGVSQTFTHPTGGGDLLKGGNGGGAELISLMSVKTDESNLQSISVTSSSIMDVNSQTSRTNNPGNKVAAAAAAEGLHPSTSKDHHHHGMLNGGVEVTSGVGGVVGVQLPTITSTKRRSPHHDGWISYALIDISSARLQCFSKFRDGSLSAPLPFGIDGAAPPLNPFSHSAVPKQHSAAPTSDHHSEQLVNEALQLFINHVYSCAAQTKASIHSMVGDTIQLTWNATGYVALPETKATQFLCRLAKAVRGDDRILTSSSSQPSPISAMVCSGQAFVHSLTSSSQQQALIVDAPFTTTLSAGLELAVRHRCLLIDETTYKASALEVDTCLVEQVTTFTSSDADTRRNYMFAYHGGSVSTKPQPSGACNASDCDTSAQKKKNTSNTTLIYQLLREKVRETSEDSEWMYQLQKDGVLTSSVIDAHLVGGGGDPSSSDNHSASKSLSSGGGPSLGSANSNNIHLGFFSVDHYARTVQCVINAAQNDTSVSSLIPGAADTLRRAKKLEQEEDKLRVKEFQQRTTGGGRGGEVAGDYPEVVSMRKRNPKCDLRMAPSFIQQLETVVASPARAKAVAGNSCSIATIGSGDPSSPSGTEERSTILSPQLV